MGFLNLPLFETPFCFQTKKSGANIRKSKTKQKISKSKNTSKKYWCQLNMRHLNQLLFQNLQILDYNSARFHDQIFYQKRN